MPIKPLIIDYGVSCRDNDNTFSLDSNLSLLQQRSDDFFDPTRANPSIGSWGVDVSTKPWNKNTTNDDGTDYNANTVSGLFLYNKSSSSQLDLQYIAYSTDDDFSGWYVTTKVGPRAISYKSVNGLTEAETLLVPSLGVYVEGDHFINASNLTTGTVNKDRLNFASVTENGTLLISDDMSYINNPPSTDPNTPQNPDITDADKTVSTNDIMFKYIDKYYLRRASLLNGSDNYITNNLYIDKSNSIIFKNADTANVAGQVHGTLSVSNFKCNLRGVLGLILEVEQGNITVQTNEVVGSTSIVNVESSQLRVNTLKNADRSGEPLLTIKEGVSILNGKLQADPPTLGQHVVNRTYMEGYVPVGISVLWYGVDSNDMLVPPSGWLRQDVPGTIYPGTSNGNAIDETYENNRQLCSILNGESGSSISTATIPYKLDADGIGIYIIRADRV